MLKGSRPQTAPSTKGRTPQEQRPLGRMPKPLLRAQVEQHGSNPESVFAAIKGDILVLQQKRDSFAAADEMWSSQRQSIEKQLLPLTTVPGDDLRTTENRCTLLETLLQTMKATCVDTLRSSGVGECYTSPSRIGGFLEVLDVIADIGNRKKAWATKIKQNAGVQYDNALEDIAMDRALNEPTVSELRNLIEEQKALQSQMKQMIPQAQVLRAATPQPVKEAERRGSGSQEQPAAEVTKKKAAATKKHDEDQGVIHTLNKENTELKAKVEELLEEVHRLAEDRELSEEHEVLKHATSLALQNVDMKYLEDVGCVFPKLPNVTAETEALVATRVSQLIAESVTAPTSPEGHKKEKERKKEMSAGVASEGALWIALRHQNHCFEAVATKLKEVGETAKEKEKQWSQRVKQLQRLMSVVENKNIAAAAESKRTITTERAALEAERKKTADMQQVIDNFSKVASNSRIINVKNQPASAAEREANLASQLAHRSQCVVDLTEKLNAQKESFAHEQATSAAVAKERYGLLQRLADEQKKSAELKRAIDTKNGEITEFRETIHNLKKDLREKIGCEADLQQRLWKLEVELHIAQNVITDLRVLEDDLLKKSNDAQSCQTAMRENAEKEREGHAKKMAALEEKLRFAVANERAAKENLRSERIRMIENEKEVERLKSLDVQMEVLEHNFTNYAASKLAQRAASEEDEKSLQSCVESLMGDVFEMPGNMDAEDQVALYLEHLKTQRAQLDNEERLRRRNKATSLSGKDDRTAKRHLTALLQQRYNVVQIFACEQRLRQLRNEREKQGAQIGLSELRSQHDSVLQELAVAKVQCDSLVQRNTELEMERSQLVRSRASAELEIKTLKQTLQRMKMNNEEQEKILVEVGTKLQSAKWSKGPGEPLGNVVIDESA